MRRSAAALLLVLAAACTHSIGERRERERERFDEPDRASLLFAQQRGTADVPARLRIASEQRARMQPDAIRPFGTWQFLGPGNIGGRTRALIIDPTNANVMYAGTVSGGVWKTTDAGAQWTPLTDALANLAVSSLALDPHDSRTLYAGTGEGYFREEIRGTALPIRGDGIFVTRDAGRSWSQLTTPSDPDFQWVNDLVISQHDSRRLYAATRTGVFRSADGGATWTRVLATTVKGGCLDLALHDGQQDDDLLASCGTFAQATVYRNTAANTDAPWQPVLSLPGMGRTSLAFAPSNPSIVYALAASNASGPGDRYTQGLLGVFRSDDGGTTWSPRVTNADPTRTNTVLLTNAIGAFDGGECVGKGESTAASWLGMGWHCNVIAVDPRDADRVWVAGVDLFRSDDGGRNWSEASYWWPGKDEPRDSFVHADQHAIVFAPGYDGDANQTMFAANDGGIYRTDNARAALTPGLGGMCDSGMSGVHFVSVNHGFGATQFYDGTVLPDGRTFFGGAQDNGTVIGTVDGGIDGWRLAVGGDGAYGGVDAGDAATIYTSWQNASIVRSNDGGTTWSDARRGLNDNFLFVAPLAADPALPARVWTGGTRIWRSTDQARNWVAASVSVDGLVSALAVAPGRSDRVIAGTSSGAIVRNDAASTAAPSARWSSTKPRSGYVSSIAFDPNDTNVVYATYADFGGPHVWRSTDAGATFTAIDGASLDALPDVPVHTLLADRTDPTHLLIGTDLGIFTTRDGGAHWLVETRFPAVITEKVVYAQGANGLALYAFTHGRGAWRVELESPPPPPRRRAAH